MPDGSGGEEDLPDLEDGPTASVGAVPGQFSVSDQGTAQYNIPIEVPPGRAGMEPALSLRYAATKASGEAGMGWKIEGLSQITRCPRVHALDGYSAPIKNDSTDLFCIDGKRLELVAGSVAYGKDGAEYRTLVDTFTKVISRRKPSGRFFHPLVSGVVRTPSDQQGPDYFEVRMKDGRILTYGRTLDSLVMARNGTRYAWLLNRVEDRAGNNIIIEYSNHRIEIPSADADKVPNAVVPQAIYYTGHGTKSGNREVRFDYEDRIDPQLSYAQGGAALAFGTRLRRIITSVRGVPAKNYRLEYEGDSASLLKKVLECVGESGAACKPPTEFEYHRESGFTVSDSPANYSLHGAGQLDVNGDGRPDFMLTTGTVGDVDANPVLTAVAIGADVAVASASYAYLTPVGGLAVSAIYQLFRGPFFGLFAAEPKVTFTTTLLTGTGVRAAPVNRIGDVPGLPCPESASSFFLDYNQDGKDDVLSLCPFQSMKAAISSGVGFDAPGSGQVAALPWDPDYPGVYSHRAPVVYDVNGDSLQDLVSCVDLGTLEVRLRLSPSEGFGEPIKLGGQKVGPPSEPLTVIIPFCSDLFATYQIFDVDGDGTPELLTYFNRGASVEFDIPAMQGWFALRLSSTGVLGWQQVPFTGVGTSSQGGGMALGDLNGDGLTDIWRDEGGDPKKGPKNEATVWLNAGGRFLSSTLARPSAFSGTTLTDQTLTSTALIDYNSDGRVDILEHWVAQPFDSQNNWALRTNGFVRNLTGTHPDDLVVRRILHGASSVSIFDGRFDAVGDIDADGNADLYGANDAVIFYGSGLRNMLLSTVKDGLGNITTIEYDGDSTYETTTDCREASQWPDQCLKTMQGLVSRHSEGAYIGVADTSIEKTFDYKYVNARMNVTGHGWLGFDQRSVTETSDGQYTTVTTEFEPPTRYSTLGVPMDDAKPIRPPYLYPLAGLARKITVDRGYVAGPSGPASPLEDAPHSRRSVVTNVWDVKLSAQLRPFPILTSATTETFSRAASALAAPIPFNENGHLRTSCTVAYSLFDGYGNHEQEVSACDAQGAEVPFEETTTITQFSPSPSTWLISNVERVTTTSTRYPGGRQTQVYDPAYDSLGQLISITRDPDKEAQLTTYVRDEFGNVERIEESAPGETTRSTAITYDYDHTFPVEVTNAKGHVSKAHFHPRLGLVRTVTDPNGVAIRYRYDGFGRRLETRAPTGVTVTTYADAAPLEGIPSPHNFPRLTVTTETRSADTSTFGGRSVQILDHMGRALRTSSVGFGGHEVISERNYDNRGRVMRETLPHLALESGAPPPPATLFSYDYLDRIMQVEHPDGTISERQYASGVSLASPHGHWLEDLYCMSRDDRTRCGVDIELSVDAHVPDEPGLRNVIVKDHAGLVVRSIDGENVDIAGDFFSSNYYYGAFNRLYATTDNGNATSIFEHDDYGRLLSHTDPDTGKSAYTYSRFGELQTSQDVGRSSRVYSYDVLGRPDKILDHDGLTTWTYDEGSGAIGKLSESKSPGTATAPAGQHVRYEYDSRGLVGQISYDLDSSTYPFALHYDALGRIETIDYPRSGGVPVRAKYHYEPESGALVSLTENGSGVERPLWKIDASFEGYLVAQQTFGNGAVSTFTYDSERRWLDTAKTRLPIPGGSVTVQDTIYDRYGNGQIRERASLHQTDAYVYDALGRISHQTTFRLDLPSTGRLASFAYDVFGNLTQNDTRTNAYNVYPTTSRPHLPDIVGINGYFHTENGNLASRQGPDIPGLVQWFSYTPFNLPRTINTDFPPATVELDYTADGTRVARRDATTVTHFASQLYERSFSSTGTLEEHFRFTAGSDLIAETLRLLPDSPASNEKTLYFHADHLATPETVSDDSGGYEHQSYDAFGNRDPGAGPPESRTDPTRIGFTGQLQETASRLIDMGGRVYDPLAGRFTTADPVVQAPFFSQGLNRYAYVFNDPLNNTDPSGFITTGTTGGDITTVAVLGAATTALGYGIATELGIGITSTGLASGLSGAGIGGLRDLITQNGPGAAKPGRAKELIPAPSAAPITSPSKVNGPTDAPSQSTPPGARKAPKKVARQTASRGAAPTGTPACDELCRSAPAGGYAPSVPHATLNEAASQVVDTSETWQTAMEIVMAASPVGPEEAVGALLGRAARSAAVAERGIVAANGRRIVGYVPHGVDRAIGDGATSAPLMS